MRRDLRLNDSAPLSAATSNGKEATVVFVWDDLILSKIKDRRNRRVSFIHKSLQEVDRKLREHGSELTVLRGDPVHEIPKLAKDLQASSVYWGEDYDPTAIRRDDQVAQALNQLRVEPVAVKDMVVFAKEEVLSQTEQPLKVFSPFARAWHARFNPERDSSEQVVNFENLSPSNDFPKVSWGLKDLGFEEVDIWLEPGETAATERLERFSQKIPEYGNLRDFPAENGTSLLSVDFRFGTLSIRKAVRACLQSDTEGNRKWLSELIWREFYQSVLFHFPQVVTEPFQPEYKGIEYPGTEEHWELWRDGNTGFPIVDAAMRCLNQTGFMPNRLRMVVASFLSKDLLLDYKKGEAWFAAQLLDYELASNNGGWQWASSVGCDPQPYFRIFNPWLQSKKFDPHGKFIRSWIPELKELPDDAIHCPESLSPFDLESHGVELGKTYPRPCVNHDEQRKKAIHLLECAKRPKS